ncbi:MAG: DNA mismatch repair endonuclease MutL [Oscillospiraceae bacterium]|jgi:DNA mismatch repair protein MutL|nr:DNA mismatch repair endonuclease MutL [Oscillospiraceae bacterium]
MNRINILDKHVSELIAAGEVVDRPASVVKELLENSIDALANKISIEIKRGGIKYIKISDNGTGIYSADIKKAFLRHATSKVKGEQDLDSIKTLGFRGEALSSISSVSKLELITKHLDEDTGTKYIIIGGEEKSLEECGCPQGTTFIVRDIFFNTPARMKFLKTDVSEGNTICALIDNIAVSHPKVSFKLVRDGKEILNTPGDGKISSCIYSVLGKNFFEELIPIEYKLDNVQIFGYISKPSCSRPGRNMQHFFVNSRYVKTKTAAFALEEGFKGCITVGKHPSCVIYINVPYNFVDVNVHPSKTEVRFANERYIFDAVYYGVKSSITKNDRQSINFSGNSKNIEYEKGSSKIEHKIIAENKVKPEFIGTDFSGLNRKLYEKEPSYNTSKIKETKPTNYIPVSGQEPIKNILREEPNLFNKIPKLKILGEIFKCYIVVQNNYDNIILIDKHAAHERIIFEKLKSSGSGKCESQILLDPIIINLNKIEYSGIIENLEIFKNSGYDLEDFGVGNILVRSIPMYTDVSETQNFVVEISNYVLKNKKDLNTSYLDWLYHNIACRSAIKGGNISSNEEISDLVGKLINNPNIRYCPHGRPIYFSLSKKDIDKKFSRT